jgi:[ribosomal protein S5]-alanine N-acetyltransferase
MTATDALKNRVTIRAPRASDERAFLEAVRASRALHRTWVQPPATPARFRKALARWHRSNAHAAFFVWRGRGELVGVVNVSEIVRGSFQSAYLGYYAFEPLAGQGFMQEGLGQVIARAFRTMRLHRLEANIQPSNTRSIRLVKRLGFRREGRSPKYLKVSGRWRDHERWALLAEDWKCFQRKDAKTQSLRPLR